MEESMSRKQSKYKIAETERISKLSNRQLLEETIELAAGDDYVGCFTNKWSITYILLLKELHTRLKDWLDDTRKT